MPSKLAGYCRTDHFNDPLFHRRTIRRYHSHCSTLPFNSDAGIQTLFVRKEAEALQEFCIGDFTRDWVDFNCNKDSEVYSDTFLSPIVVTYGISRFWASFRFQEPSTDEMDRHWRENFSISLKPFMQLCSMFDRMSICCICNCLSRSITLLRMWLWAPNPLDIGHGFKLIRFFKLPNNSSIL